MTTIKVLGTGCIICKRLLADLKEMNNFRKVHDAVELEITKLLKQIG